MAFRLYTVRIFAQDWGVLTAFYRDTLALPEKFASAEMGWAEYDVGGPSLAVERIPAGDTEGAELAGRFLGISLEVDDIEQVHRDLTARGVTFTGPPARQPWGGILAHLADPEGNVITLLGK